MNTPRSYRMSKHHTRIMEVFGSKNHKILGKYNEILPQRVYHNWPHIEAMLDSAALQGILSEELLLAIVFHDIVYDPKAFDNEEKSAELFLETFGARGDVAQAILDTKTHKATTKLSEKLIALDLEILNTDLKGFMEFEDKIFKEYEFVSYGIYKEKRVEVLKHLGVRQEYIDYVKNRKIRIGIYAGSFNPFHQGHLDILVKAEKMFDKVIIARGMNPDKKNQEFEDFPELIQYREIITYDGLLSAEVDKIKEFCDSVTIVRGLRNGSDLSYEMNQYAFWKDMDPSIQVCALFCDKVYEHISSSAIRSLRTFGYKHWSEM